MPDLNQHASGSGSQQAGRDINNDFHIDADAIADILSRRPTEVAKVVIALVGKINTNENLQGTTLPYQIQEKIDFNSVVIYKEIFERYAGFAAVIDGICENLDTDTPAIKRKLFEYIQTQYLLERGVVTKKGLEPSKYSDEIVTAVKDHLHQMLLGDTSTQNLTQEEIELCLMALTTKAFIDCRLLEHPPVEKN